MKHPMLSVSTITVSAALALVFAAPVSAQPAKPATKQVMIEGVGAVEVTRITASVEAVDVKNRVVTLKGPRGNTFAVPVSAAVKNLPQVKVGDMVVLEYYESVAIEVKATESMPTLTETSVAARAKEGAKPGAVALRKVHVVTNVLGVNTESQSVLVRGPLGHLTEVKIKDPKMVASLKTGGQIDLTYIEGIAIAVQAEAKKK